MTKPSTRYLTSVRQSTSISKAANRETTSSPTAIATTRPTSQSQPPSLKSTSAHQNGSGVWLDLFLSSYFAGPGLTWWFCSYSIFIGLVIIVALCVASWFLSPKGEHQVSVHLPPPAASHSPFSLWSVQRFGGLTATTGCGDPPSSSPSSAATSCGPSRSSRNYIP